MSLAAGALVLLCLATARAAPPSQATYSSAEEAVAALIGAVRAEGTDELVTVLGAAGREIASSGDEVADRDRRARFISAFEEAHSIQRESASRAVLIIGRDEFPFPIPMIQEGNAWRWDTDAGLDEILTRRIGENELTTIEVMRAIAEAQQQYASIDRDGRGVQYARRLLSREGKKDGLYWPASSETDQSPIGPLIARAQSEGYRRNSKSDDPPAYHGYQFRVLYGQGANATGGARDYIVNDRMIGGFAVIATPAEYANSGVMTFLVGHDGDVYQKDLGPDPSAAASVKLFNPDLTWTKVAPSE
jgi:hypothetical protein